METLTGNKPSIRSKAVFLRGWGMRTSTRELSLAMISMASSWSRWSWADCSLLWGRGVSLSRGASSCLLCREVSWASKPLAGFFSPCWGWADDVWRCISCSGGAAEKTAHCSGCLSAAFPLRHWVLCSSSTGTLSLPPPLGTGIEVSGVCSFLSWPHTRPVMSLCSWVLGPFFSGSWKL